MDESRKITDIYNKIAKKYSEVFDADRDDDLYIDDFLNLLNKKARILDLGCGTGRIAGYIHAKGFGVLGVDLSEGMLEIAKKNYPGIEFIKEDMRNIEFEKKSFDAVLIAYSIFHLNKSEALELLKKVNSILKPNGLACLVFQEGSGGEVYIDEPFLPGEKLFLRLYSEDETKEIVEENNFRILKMQKRKPDSTELNFNKLFLICQKV